MANDKKKQVEQITDMEVDFAQWYTDVCKKAELIDYSSIKGMFIYRPYGYAIWENIQREMDRRFKETGHENVYLPMLIPESLLQKEKDHVEGFAPECAWVTYGGSEKLEERYCIRPTSETLFCEPVSYTHLITEHTITASSCAGRRCPRSSSAARPDRAPRPRRGRGHSPRGSGPVSSR